MGGYLANRGMPSSHLNIEFTTSGRENEETTHGVNQSSSESKVKQKGSKSNIYLQSVSWSLAKFRHNKIVQLPRDNCLHVCRKLQRKVRSRKHDV